MIRYDHRHSQLPGQPDLLRGSDSVVAGHQRIHLIRRRLTDHAFIHPVAVGDPVRDLIIDPSLCPRKGLRYPPKPRKKQIRRTDAVYIIIPNYSDSFPAFQLFHKDFRRPLHIGHPAAVIQVVRRPVQVPAHCLFRFQPPVAHDPDRNRAHSQLLGKSFKIRPFGLHHPDLLTVLLHIPPSLFNSIFRFPKATGAAPGSPAKPAQPRPKKPGCDSFQSCEPARGPPDNPGFPPASEPSSN